MMDPKRAMQIINRLLATAEDIETVSALELAADALTESIENHQEGGTKCGQESHCCDL